MSYNQATTLAWLLERLDKAEGLPPFVELSLDPWLRDAVRVHAQWRSLGTEAENTPQTVQLERAIASRALALFVAHTPSLTQRLLQEASRGLTSMRALHQALRRRPEPTLHTIAPWWSEAEGVRQMRLVWNHLESSARRTRRLMAVLDQCTVIARPLRSLRKTSLPRLPEDILALDSALPVWLGAMEPALLIGERIHGELHDLKSPLSYLSSNLELAMEFLGDLAKLSDFVAAQKPADAMQTWTLLGANEGTEECIQCLSDAEYGARVICESLEGIQAGLEAARAACRGHLQGL